MPSAHQQQITGNNCSASLSSQQVRKKTNTVTADKRTVAEGHYCSALGLTFLGDLLAKLSAWYRI